MGFGRGGGLGRGARGAGGLEEEEEARKGRGLHEGSTVGHGQRALTRSAG